jgi:hypothetical protein
VRRIGCYQQASFQVEFNGVRILATILQFERFRVDVSDKLRHAVWPSSGIRCRMSSQIDFYERRVNRIANTPEAQQLRLEICWAVDAYARYFEKHGLKLHISFGRDTKPADLDNVVVFADWDSVRGGGGHGGSGSAA